MEDPSKTNRNYEEIPPNVRAFLIEGKKSQTASIKTFISTFFFILKENSFNSI